MDGDDGYASACTEVGRLMGSVGLANQIGGSLGIAIGGASVTLSGGYGPAVLVGAGVALICGARQGFVSDRAALP